MPQIIPQTGGQILPTGSGLSGTPLLYERQPTIGSGAMGLTPVVADTGISSSGSSGITSSQQPTQQQQQQQRALVPQQVKI
jgi:hypothetical protein